MPNPVRLGVGLGLRLTLSLGLGSVGLWAGCSQAENFTQCHMDSDCPAAVGSSSKLYCTADNLCSAGTPAAKLCTDTYPANPPSNAIVIGVLTNIVNGSDGPPVQAFKQAIDEMNALRASTGDRQLSLNLCEISATPADPLKAMKILTHQRGAVAVLGPSSSASVLSIAPEVVASQVPIMSQSASSPAISDLPATGLFFRVVPSDNAQGPVLNNQLPTSTAKFDMITVDDSYGTGLQQAFFRSTTRTPFLSVKYAELGGTQAALSAALVTVANQIITDSPFPDHVIAITNNLAPEVVKDLQNLNINTKILMTDGAKNQELLTLSSTGTTAMKMHLGRITGTAPTVDLANSTSTGAYSQFLSTYQQKWGTSAAVNNYIAYAYDGAYAVGIAIGAAGGNVTPQTVSAMLLRLNNQTDRVTVGATNYLMAKNKLASNTGITLQGTTGNIRFSGHGDRDGGLYEVWSIDTTTNTFKSAPAQ